MATTVDIHLPMNSTAEWIRALSIPHKDIQRFTFRPLKWLRFATFAVCGAKGHLSATEGGEAVDYEGVQFANLADRYFYHPHDEYHLVDYKAIDGKYTPSAVTPRQTNFRRLVRARDGGCAFTGRNIGVQAAHIIPRRKGNNYISFVVRDRSCLYDQTPFSPGEDGQVDVDIDCVENGIFLEAGLRDLFKKGQLGFLKTPNFAMDPRDVPRVEEGPVLDQRTTLQYMRQLEGLDLVRQRDVLVDWGDDAPPNILLDYMYGAAIVRWWKSDRLQRMLEERYEDSYQVLKSVSEDDAEEEPLDPDEFEWTPSESKTDGGLMSAMDDMLLLSMLLKGTTPQAIAAEQERQLKEEELRSQERSREKVQEWLKS